MSTEDKSAAISAAGDAEAAWTWAQSYSWLKSLRTTA
jgi:hypothetical protein